VAWNYVPRRRTAISPAAFRVIRGCDGTKSVAHLAAEAGLSAAETAALLDELVELWSLRYVTLLP
jgi:hypothetical protein